MGDDYDAEILGTSHADEVVAEVVNEPQPQPQQQQQDGKAAKGKQRGVRKRLNATQKSLMKTVLFKPYNELPNTEEEDGENSGEPRSENTKKEKRRPLGSKNTDAKTQVNPLKDSNKMSQRNVSEKSQRNVSEKVVIDKLPLHKLSLQGKENRVALK